MKYVDNVCSKIVTPLKSSVKGFLFEVGLILNTTVIQMPNFIRMLELRLNS